MQTVYNTTANCANKTYVSSKSLECSDHFLEVTIFCCLTIHTISVDTSHKVMKHGSGYNSIVFHFPFQNFYSCNGCLGKVRTAWSVRRHKRIKTTVPYKHTDTDCFLIFSSFWSKTMELQTGIVFKNTSRVFECECRCVCIHTMQDLLITILPLGQPILKVVS